VFPEAVARSRRRKPFGFSAALLALVPVCAAAADKLDEFRQWQRQEQAAFKKFKDERDREFADYLRTQWQEFQTFRGIKRDPTPKPDVIPAAPRVPPPPPEARKPPAPPPVVQVKPEPPRAPAPVAPPAPPPPPRSKQVTLAFYGQNVVVHYDPSIEARLAGAPGSESIANYWTGLGQSEYEPLLKRLRTVHTSLGLEDWAYADLVRAFSQQVHPRSENDARLLLWFLLTKSGYKVRVAYSDSRIHLFVPTEQKIYETKFLTIQGQAHYAALERDRGASVGRVYTYDKEYPGQARNMDLRIASLRFTKPAIGYRELKFEYGNRKYAFRVPVDRRVIEFMDGYPVTDLQWYFLAATSEETRAVLVRELRAATSGMHEDEALNLLLRFAQTAFAYKTDGDQFGREKYMFVEETLSYPYSDCEDRAVLYAWLVREVIGGEVIGLSYPGHVATAVRVRNLKTGVATVDYDGKRYVVADPTYIGADVGMAMPQYANVRPDVVRIK
jgi:hypothetical protein